MLLWLNAFTRPDPPKADFHIIMQIKLMFCQVADGWHGPHPLLVAQRFSPVVGNTAWGLMRRPLLLEAHPDNRMLHQSHVA